jgi:type IV pilus assembly protein PilA
MRRSMHDFDALSVDRDCCSMWTGNESKSGMTCAYGIRVPRKGQKSASLRGSYGFTLVELMIVIAMIGVLAALGVVGFRKYIRAAAAAEVKAVIQGIRVSQEAIKAETFQYRSCSTSLTNWYPGTPNAKKRHWDNGQVGNAVHDCWMELNVTTDGPVRFGYAVVAGIAPQPNAVPNIPYVGNWTTAHSTINGPWFVVQAAGDQDADGKLSLFASSSLSGEIFVEPTHGDDE